MSRRAFGTALVVLMTAIMTQPAAALAQEQDLFDAVVKDHPASDVLSRVFGKSATQPASFKPTGMSRKDYLALIAGNVDFFWNNIYLFPAITVFTFVEIVTVSTAMLALSSLSNSSRYVGILYAALLFFSQALFGVLRLVTGDTRLSWISVPFDLNQVGDAIFRLPLRYDTPWPLSLAVLLLLVVASGLVLERRVRGVEVVA